MGENQALVWLLLGFVMILVIGIIFTNTFDINALTFFSGVS